MTLGGNEMIVPSIGLLIWGAQLNSLKQRVVLCQDVPLVDGLFRSGMKAHPQAKVENRI